MNYKRIKLISLLAMSLLYGCGPASQATKADKPDKPDENKVVSVPMLNEKVITYSGKVAKPKFLSCCQKRCQIIASIVRFIHIKKSGEDGRQHVVIMD